MQKHDETGLTAAVRACSGSRCRLEVADANPRDAACDVVDKGVGSHRHHGNESEHRGGGDSGNAPSATLSPSGTWLGIGGKTGVSGVLRAGWVIPVGRVGHFVPPL